MFFITGEDYTIAMERHLILSTEFPNATITIDIVDDVIFEPDDDPQSDPGSKFC